MKTIMLLIAGASLALSVATSQAQNPVNLVIPGGNAASLICLPWSQNPASPLEFLAYLQGGETLTVWTGSAFYSYTYQGYGVGTGLGFPSDFTDANPGTGGAIPGSVYDTDNEVYWAPTPVFAAGESFWIMNPGATIHCIIHGSGPLTKPVTIHGGNRTSYAGSAMTTGGDSEGAPINLTANFAGGEVVYVWNGTGYYAYVFAGAGVGTGLRFPSDYFDLNPGTGGAIPNTVYDPDNEVYWTPPLTINVGQGLIISNPNTDEQWVESIVWP